MTARHQAEEQARTGEQRLRLAAQATSEFAIVVAEPDGRIVSWNAGAERIFGYAEAEVIGRDIALIYEAADREAALPPRERELAAAEGHVDDERWYVTKDHRRIYCSGVVTQIVDASFRGFAKIVRDLTVRKLQESARDPSGAHVPQESALQTTGKPLTDEFIAVLSQELKRPLNLIGIKAEMPPRLPETRGIEAVHAAASSIRQAVGSQAQTIDDLLELSRVAADKLVLDLQPVDLAAMLSDIAAAAAVDANARGISLSVSGTQQPAMTLADPVRSEQILWNLVANALKFTDDGGRIELRLARDDHALHIEVADDGQGIDAAELPHVFDMFRRRRRDRANDGLGIGLAKQLGELQGGDVTAASAGAGSGATLSVRLPALAARDTGGVLTAAAQSVAGVRMLVVCEDEETASSIASLLRLEHADVQVASNADTALICSPGIRRTRCCAKRRCRAGKAMRLCEGSRPTRHSRT
nr:ATP-binding protein [Paraburkholderia phosphatilytica]